MTAGWLFAAILPENDWHEHGLTWVSDLQMPSQSATTRARNTILVSSCFTGGSSLKRKEKQPLVATNRTELEIQKMVSVLE